MNAQVNAENTNTSAMTDEEVKARLLAYLEANLDSLPLEEFSEDTLEKVLSTSPEGIDKNHPGLESLFADVTAAYMGVRMKKAVNEAQKGQSKSPEDKVSERTIGAFATINATLSGWFRAILNAARMAWQWTVAQTKSLAFALWAHIQTGASWAWKKLQQTGSLLKRAATAVWSFGTKVAKSTFDNVCNIGLVDVGVAAVGSAVGWGIAGVIGLATGMSLSEVVVAGSLAFAPGIIFGLVGGSLFMGVMDAVSDTLQERATAKTVAAAAA